jgi:hypothetical protein
LIGLYFGFLGGPILVFSTLLSFFTHKILLQKKWTSRKILSLTTFLCIIFLLIFYR